MFSKILFGMFSKSLIIVEPVVVMIVECIKKAFKDLRSENQSLVHKYLYRLLDEERHVAQELF